MTDACTNLIIGNPMDPDRDMGPQTSQKLMEQMHEQVRESEDAGANCTIGGESLDCTGTFCLLSPLPSSLTYWPAFPPITRSCSIRLRPCSKWRTSRRRSGRRTTRRSDSAPASGRWTGTGSAHRPADRRRLCVRQPAPQGRPARSVRRGQTIQARTGVFRTGHQGVRQPQNTLVGMRCGGPFTGRQSLVGAPFSQGFGGAGLFS